MPAGTSVDQSTDLWSDSRHDVRIVCGRGARKGEPKRAAVRHDRYALSAGGAGCPGRRSFRRPGPIPSARRVGITCCHPPARP